MEKIDRKSLEEFDVFVRCNVLLSKINELVEECNSHKEWHRRFFDKYNKTEKGSMYEDCPICHGAGATTDHHDPCTECGGSGKIGEG